MTRRARKANIIKSTTKTFETITITSVNILFISGIALPAFIVLKEVTNERIYIINRITDALASAMPGIIAWITLILIANIAIHAINILLPHK